MYVKKWVNGSEGKWESTRKICSLGMFDSDRVLPLVSLFVGVRLVYLSLRCTATFVISFHWSLLLAVSLHFSSSSAFLRSLFTQSSHLSCGLPHFLQPSSSLCFFVADLFGNLSSLILTMCPAHFTRLFLTIWPTIRVRFSSNLFVSDRFSNLSSFIMTISPAHFTRLFLTIWPTIHALVPTSSFQIVSAISRRSL